MRDLTNDGHPHGVGKAEELGRSDKEVAEKGEDAGDDDYCSFLDSIGHFLDEYTCWNIKHRQNCEKHANFYLRQIVVFYSEGEDWLHKAIEKVPYLFSTYSLFILFSNIFRSILGAVLI